MIGSIFLYLRVSTYSAAHILLHAKCDHRGTRSEMVRFLGQTPWIGVSQEPDTEKITAYNSSLALWYPGVQLGA